MLDHFFFFFNSLTFFNIFISVYFKTSFPMHIGTLHGSLCPIGTFSFWAFIPYSFLIIPSHPVKSITFLFSTFLLPTNEREIKQPPPPPPFSPPLKKRFRLQIVSSVAENLLLHCLF